MILKTLEIKLKPKNLKGKQCSDIASRCIERPVFVTNINNGDTILAAEIFRPYL